MLTHGVTSACSIVKHPNIKIQYLEKKTFYVIAILCKLNGQPLFIDVLMKRVTSPKMFRIIR